MKFKITSAFSFALLAMACWASLVHATQAPLQEAPSLHYKLARVGRDAGLRFAPLDETRVAKAELGAGKGAPMRYAISHDVSVDSRAKRTSAGRWQDVGDGMRLWRLRIDAPGALAIDVAFKPFHLPAGAALYFTDASGRFVRGPYTEADNTASGEFWTPYVPGDVAHVELLVPAAAMKGLRLSLFNVNQAYRNIHTGQSAYAKSGSCNVDVACSQGDAYRDQIRAVAMYTVGGLSCTGQLVNNTANDNRRHFITARHCISTQSNASGVVAYWHYENPTCRTPGSSASGNPIPFTGNSIAQTGGSMLRATHAPSDTTLIELNTAIPAGVTPYWDGWDRSETPKSSAILVHHPNGDEKRISFENEPLILSNGAVSGILATASWVVADWNVGTTEEGSSGSGLLTPQKRLIGVLSGGGLQICGPNLNDHFGRLSVAWEGGGTAASRVRDWLDPANTGAVTLDGRAACTAPSVTLSKNIANPSVDTVIGITASISGGTGPYTVQWDVDGDAQVDRTTAAVAQSTTIPVRYPVATTVNVQATVTGADSCVRVVSLPLNVSAPDIVATASAPTQVCGDGDTAIEPGERWQVPVQLQNVGGDGLNNAYAQFTALRASPVLVDAPRDTFGYRVADSTGPSCRYQAVDMSGATVVAPDEADDGITAALPVGGATPFRFYGQNITQLRMTTNGYLASSPEEDGGDYENECGISDSFFDDNARLLVLNDDFVMQPGGSLRHRHFSACPRLADGGLVQGCTVFEWNNLGRYASASAPPVGNAVFQAILYDQSYQIVYQYVTADPLAGGSASIAIENAAKTDRLQYSCDEGNRAPSGRAVCYFEPSALPSGLPANPLSLEGAAQQALPDLQSGQTAQRSVPFRVPTNAACGAPIGVRYVGTVDDSASSNRSDTIYIGTVGNGGTCQTSQCNIDVAPANGMPRDGLYTIVNRSGNGIGMFNINAGGAIANAGTWFSGRANRLPTWYLHNGSWVSDDRRAELNFFQFTQSAPGVFPANGVQVGTGVLTHDGAGDDYVMSWTLHGISRIDKLTRTFTNSNVGQANHTGLWNTVGQSGWGVLFDDHLNVSSGVESLAVDYLYDNQGQPTWVLGAAGNLSGTMPMNVYQVHCPWCPNLTDFASATFTAAGSQTRSFIDASNGLFGSAILVPQTGTTWNRDNLPIRLLTTPLQ